MDPDAVSKWIADMLFCETMYFQSVTVDVSKLNYKLKQQNFVSVLILPNFSKSIHLLRNQYPQV